MNDGHLDAEGPANLVIVSPSGLFITKKSSIPGVRYGMFTRVPIPEGAAIGPYEGDIYTFKRFKQFSQEIRDAISLYAFEITDDKNQMILVDPTNDGVEWKPTKLRLMASCNESPKGGCDNVVPIRIDKKMGAPSAGVYFVAARNIKQDEELFVYYGDGYDRGYKTGKHVDADWDGKTLLPP